MSETSSYRWLGWIVAAALVVVAILSCSQNTKMADGQAGSFAGRMVSDGGVGPAQAKSLAERDEHSRF